MKDKERKITKLDVVLWELFPIAFGDKVRVKGTRRIGELTGMTIPLSTSGRKDTHIEYYEKCEYTITFKRCIRGYKRWEIEKVEKEN